MDRGRERSDDGGRGPIVEVRDVVFRYGRRAVLNGVDLALDAGSTCVLVGPNGAGKSTLVRIVCGSLPPLSGTVRIGGVDPARASTGRSPIAAVPQRSALFQRLTVRENVEILSDLSGRPGTRADCDRALALASATAFADRRVETLSGGQARLANIAAVLAGNPALLVLDEPTVGVDEAGRAVLSDTIERLRAGGMAILFITHDLDFAERTATHAALFAAGRVTMAGHLPSLVADTFGAGAAEITAMLEADPAPAERDLLAARGLRPNGGARTWSTIESDPERTAALHETLRGALPSLLELRTRRAGLSALLRSAPGMDAEVAA